MSAMAQPLPSLLLATISSSSSSSTPCSLQQWLPRPTPPLSCIPNHLYLINVEVAVALHFTPHFFTIHSTARHHLYSHRLTPCIPSTSKSAIDTGELVTFLREALRSSSLRLIASNPTPCYLPFDTCPDPYR
ncbi:hypothetical protein RIF29_38810 [Crotalaria pallida]|uniref:Uncharacterized protein n=1 Tax=Crotalaria pallida TaxID=3830 RepID=A0AAN9E0P1_CROPI